MGANSCLREISQVFFLGSPAGGRYRGSECDSSFERDKASCMSGGEDVGWTVVLWLWSYCFESDARHSFPP